MTSEQSTVYGGSLKSLRVLDVLAATFNQQDVHAATEQAQEATSEIVSSVNWESKSMQRFAWPRRLLLSKT